MLDDPTIHVKNAYKEWGLDAEFSQHHDTAGKKYTIGVFKEVEIPFQDRDDRSVIQKNLFSIIRDIQDSPAMERIRKCHSDKVKELEERIAELEKYESFYNMWKGLK